MKTLVILAAGIGSRYGGGIKQLEAVDARGHLIIDYSIHDAIAAGFNKIVFIIRHDIEEDFRAIIGDRIEEICKPLGVEVAYTFQSLASVPFPVPPQRTKPWGTGHAVLCAAKEIDSPFAVINADDYYGRDGFVKAANFLETGEYGLVAYILKNTLSDNGGVTRGICSVSEGGQLLSIKETKNIIKTGNGAEVNGEPLDPASLVSMNFWCYPRSFLRYLAENLPVFYHNMKDPLKDEYLLPIIADGMLEKGFKYDVMLSEDCWFGMTYKEDKDAVMASIRALIDDGVYKEDLYSDLGE